MMSVSSGLIWGYGVVDAVLLFESAPIPHRIHIAQQSIGRAAGALFFLLCFALIEFRNTSYRIGIAEREATLNLVPHDVHIHIYVLYIFNHMQCAHNRLFEFSPSSIYRLYSYTHILYIYIYRKNASQFALGLLGFRLLYIHIIHMRLALDRTQYLHSK